MRCYRRVAYEDRCQIHAFLQAEISIEVIADKLGFHRSSIYREISRNCLRRQYYTARKAHHRCRKRISKCRRPRVITGQLQEYIIEHLKLGWSPEQIAGRLRLTGSAEVSTPTIYRFVRENWDELKTCLRWFNKRGAGRLRLRRSKRRMGLSIYSRPQVVNQRRRRGDWERDCFMVAQRKLVLVCTDRLSRYTLIRRVNKFKAQNISSLTMKMISTTGKRTFTITNDNGTEFRDGPNMSVPVYFCTPNKPQQRGTVENTIGLIRHYIKRNTDHDLLINRTTGKVENLLNHRPRKCLDFRTPHEVFFNKSVALAL